MTCIMIPHETNNNDYGILLQNWKKSRCVWMGRTCNQGINIRRFSIKPQLSSFFDSDSVSDFENSSAPLSQRHPRLVTHLPHLSGPRG